tara:strand:- start:497 stop:910 length:414 start_codon:yes stop_codon:yes gene_type:complete
MFRLCSSVKVKDNFSDVINPNGYTDEIVKQNAFSMKKNLTYNVTTDYNDDDLYHLVYLGPICISYSKLVRLFGEPQEYPCINAPHMKEIIWYIKFNNNNVCAINKFFVFNAKKKYIDKFRLCGNSKNVIKDIVYVVS